MFCNYCGKELKDGAVFCTSCGNRVPEPVPTVGTQQASVAAAPQPQPVYVPQTPVQQVPVAPASQQPVYVQQTPVVQAPQQPVYVAQPPVQETIPQQQYVPQAPVQQSYYEEPKVETFELNQAPVETKTKKGLSKGKIAAIAIGAVVLVAAVLVVLNFGAIQNFFLRNSSPDQIMKTVEKEEIGQVVNSVTDVYGNVLDSFNGNSGGQAMEANMNIVLSDETLTMLQEMMYYQGVDMDLSFLQKITLSVSSNSKDSMQQVVMGLGLGDVRILTLDMIMDMDQMTLWLGVPELSSEYVEMDYADLGMSSSDMTQMMTVLEDMAQCLPSEEVVNSLLNKYIGIALDQITVVEKSEGTLQLQEMSMDCICLKSTIDEKTVMNMAIAVLKEARNDQQIKTIINDVASYAAEVSGVPASEVSNVYTQYQEAVDLALEELNAQLEYCGEEAIYFYDYLDDNNNVIGRRISLGEGMPDIYYYTVYDGNNHAFIMDLQEVKITGSGTKNGNLTSGTYLVSVNGADMIQIDIMDLDEARLEKNELSGTIGLSFTAEFAEMMAYEMGDSSAASMLPTLQLQLEMDTTSDYATVNLKVLFNGIEMFGLYTDSKLVNGGMITVPTYTVSATDEEALMYWMMSMDLNALMARLEEAGIPSEILEQIMYGMS